MKRPIIELKGIEYSRFDQKILNDIELSVDEGDFVILMGPNGSGKSSLLKILNGSVKPNRGEISVLGENIVSWPTHKIARMVATLTQDLRQSTFSDLTVAMNLELALSRSSNAKRHIDDKGKYLATFNPTLKERTEVLAGHLSGGQRQSLALAMCFAHTPRVLLLDEHTSALDPKAAASLMNLTNEHVCEKKLTTIMITHNLEHARRYGNRLIAINEGRIVRDIRAEEKAKLQESDLIALIY